MMAQMRTRIPAWLVIVPALLLIAVPVLNSHALERHGPTAQSARNRMSSFEPSDDDDDDKYWEGTQEDGRTVRILRLDKLPGKPTTWAVLVIGGTAGVGVYCVTAFLTQSKKQVKKMKDRCH